MDPFGIMDAQMLARQYGQPPFAVPDMPLPWQLNIPKYILRGSSVLLIVVGVVKFVKIQKSLSILRSSSRPRRLLKEDKGIEGCSWFAKRGENKWHGFANSLRLITIIAFSPICLLPPYVMDVVHLIKSMWMVEIARPFDAVLARSPGDGQPATYDVSGSRPRWLLKVTSRRGGAIQCDQVSWSDDVRDKGYLAISYPTRSAEILFNEAGCSLQDASPYADGQRWSYRDRKSITKRVLLEYVAARRRSALQGDEATWTGYIWLDEFCISDENETNLATIKQQRGIELGQMADIFRGAVEVVVFCHEYDCDHTGLNCFWGGRVFTLAEILHAKHVTRMTRTRRNLSDTALPLTSLNYPSPVRDQSGDAFRRAIQNYAETGGRWHLHAIMQHAANAGAFSWQSAIHSLVVEVIRRDEIGNFLEHEFLGKALNGLLPRRARPRDLMTEDGWADLAWLLELNQAFYNAASLAAICSLGDAYNGDYERHPWLGRPVLPTAGTERLEPIVTAFPVRNPLVEGAPSALSIVGPQTIGVSHVPKRDANGFYTNKEMQGLRWLSFISLVVTMWLDVEVIWPWSGRAALFVAWLNTGFYCLTKLIAGTAYLERKGWVYLDDSEWGHNPQTLLGNQDYNLRSLTHWGRPGNQLVPAWHAPTGISKPGTLVDLANKVYANITVIETPNALVPLAVHGSGITCMLLNRSHPIEIVQRYGMVNLPTYVLAQTARSGSVCVGGSMPVGYPWESKD